MDEQQNTTVPDKALGKLPAKSSPKQLQFAALAPALKVDPTPPASVKFWGKRRPFPAQTFGNTEVGCCTRASQAVAIMRMERLEQRRTVTITTDEVLNRYYAMTSRLYGGGDTGAYETDALDEWRREDLTLRDTKGRPYTIDAYIRVNQSDPNEVRKALAFSKAHGFKACYSLPLAWSSRDIPDVWDVPTNQPLIGVWLPGTWGGHSTSSFADYNADGLQIDQTWYQGGKEVNYGIQRVTWAGFTAYSDECYIVIDSLNKWKQKGILTKRQAEIIADAVNNVSSVKVAA